MIATACMRFVHKAHNSRYLFINIDLVNGGHKCNRWKRTETRRWKQWGVKKSVFFMGGVEDGWVCSRKFDEQTEEGMQEELSQSLAYASDCDNSSCMPSSVCSSNFLEHTHPSSTPPIKKTLFFTPHCFHLRVSVRFHLLHLCPPFTKSILMNK